MGWNLIADAGIATGTLATISQIMWVQLQFNKMEVIAYLAELLDLNVILICFVLWVWNHTGCVTKDHVSSPCGEISLSAG